MRALKLSLCGMAAFLVISPAASAQDQTVTALADSDLSVSVPATVVTAGFLKPGETTNFTPTALAVVAPSAAVTPWALDVKDSANAGLLQKTGDLACIAASADEITNALTFSAATTVEAGGGLAGTVDSTDVDVAGGSSLADTVNVTYSVLTPANTQLAAACPYTTTLTYTLTG